MDQEKIGKFIQEKRKEQNLTQSDLAEKLNITDRAISKWENGNCLPDAGTMPELCKLLNISINDLFSGEIVDMKDWLRVALIIIGIIPFAIGISYAIRIEQIAGYYECPNCNHKYIPTYKSVLFAMHVNRTRKMKCPKCGKKGWHKKVLK